MTSTEPAMHARSVVVTGVGRSGQIGEAVAHAFALTGAVVSIVARRLADAEERAADLDAAGSRVHPFACDLTDHSACAVLARDVLRVAGRVDVLVNIAGGFAFSGPVADSDPAVLASQYAVNVATAYCATRAFLPALRESSGVVVFTTSATALPGARVRGMSAYVMAKMAVIGLMQAVAQEGHSHGVRANAIAPGPVRTSTNLASMPEDTRYVEREAVASAVMFLASADAITGQVVELSP